jgi:phosphate-selective porin OprO and OprP
MNSSYFLTALTFVTAFLFSISILQAQSIQNVQVRGDVQIDGRFFLNDEEDGYTDTFLIRRARISVQGNLNNYFSFRIMPNFGGGNPDLQDAYIDFKPTAYLTFRAGKFKSPVGLERLKSPTNLILPELALPTNLLPIRDTGIQATGTIANGLIQIQVGLFNGALDNGSINTDYNNAKELVGRVFIRPFITSENPLLNGLGLGVAGTSDDQEGTIGSPRLPSYSSGGRQTIFRYRSDATAGGTTIANGKQSRFTPQLYYYTGPLGVMYEYAASTHNVKNGDNSASLTHTAWNIQASYLLTGENNSYGAIHPTNSLGSGYGAFEISARYGVLSFDDNTYPLYSDPNRIAETINAWAVGINWYPTSGTRLSLSYEQTNFETVTGYQAIDDEKVFTSRIQVAF